MKKLLDLSSLIINECQKLEPGHTEVCIDSSEETKVTFENVDYSVAASNQSTVFGIRNIVNQRQGFVTSNSLSEGDLKEKAREVQMVARLSPPSAFHGIAPKQETCGHFELVDSVLNETQPKQLLEWLRLLVENAKADERVALDRAEISLSHTLRIIQNSEGNLQTMKQTTCGWYLMGMARDGEQVTSFDYDGNYAGRFSDVEKMIQLTARDFSTSVLHSLNPESAKSYNGKALLHPAAVGSLLLGVIGFNVNARSQQDGMSQWKEAFDTSVAASLLTVEEDPVSTERPASWTPFDREGVLTRKHTIIDKGFLKFTAHNAFTAQRGKAKLTGNAVGSARGVPAIGLHGLKILPGDASLEDLYNDVGTGLLIKRFSGNSDPVSGQFSGIAKNSFWIDKGSVAHPIKEVMISGNMFELLKSVRRLGKDLYNQGGSYDAPYVIVDGLSITAG